MPTQDELVNFLREGEKQGATRAQMTEQLVSHGWTLLQVNAAFIALHSPPAPTLSVNASTAPQMTSPVSPPVSVSAPAVAPLMPMTSPAPQPVVAEFNPSPSPVNMPASVQTPAPVQTMASTFPTASAGEQVVRPVSPPPRQKSGGILLPLIVTAVVILFLGGTAYAYFNKIGPFGRIPYTESNFISGLLARGASIKSATYSFEGALTVEDREEDAEPFTLTISNEGERRQQYQNDYQRANNITSILSGLRIVGAPYPSTLSQLMATLKAKGSFYGDMSTIDPGTKQPYAYKSTQGGNNFELAVAFEAGDNIASVRASSPVENGNTKEVDGKFVFTKDSSHFFFFRNEPPKPLLVQLGEMMRFLPAEMQLNVGITAATVFETDATEWKFNVGASGDFGDLSYKIDIDALRKDDTYYVRINNLPSLFLGSFASVKGQWVSVGPESASSTPGMYNSLNGLAEQFKRAEEEYKKTRSDWTDFYQKVATFADEEKLIAFKEPPRSEKVDGRLLYRYEISVRKESIIPFLTKVIDEAKNHESLKNVRAITDEGIIAYLQSDEFSQMFDYLDKNISVVFHVDPLGYPAQLSYSLRIVPPDTAVQLAGKQGRITWTTTVADINKSVQVDAPQDAKPLSELVQESNDNRYGYAKSANIKANLAALATNAELAYDKNNGKYGAQSFPLGACKKTAGTLFGESDIFTILTSAQSDPSLATCASTASAFAVSVPLPDAVGYSFCVDSTGFRGQISGAIKGTKCQ